MLQFNSLAAQSGLITLPLAVHIDGLASNLAGPLRTHLMLW